MLTKTKALLILAFAASQSVFAQSSSEDPTPTEIISTEEGGDAVSTISVSTVIASPSSSPDEPLPSEVDLPPKQAWCPGDIFCAGALLQTVNVANLYVDQKTFTDKPTVRNSSAVLTSFQELVDNNQTDIGDILDFVNENFGGEGGELQALQLADFVEEPQFLSNVTDDVVRAFAQEVHSYWFDLIRSTNETALCDGVDCESTLIPLNHTFVVPGGRFREQYYWDSFWIVEGLIQSELYEVVNATLQNFMDELETIGFIPNGGRTYFLNRSQPPLFTHMLVAYVAASNDTSILERALPLAEKEMQWWQDERSLEIESPYSNSTHLVYRYAVNNTAPRPESYLTDYHTANDPELPTLTEDERSELYAQLATGAESGWDFSARWYTDPRAKGNAGLRTLNGINIIPIDLNSILYKAHLNLASLYNNDEFGNSSLASDHMDSAADLKDAIIDLCWDAEKLAFYDFNLNGTERSTFFSAAHFYAFWNDIIPDEVLNSTENAFKAFSSVNLVMNRYNGTYPVSFIESGLQWDAPNAWPPHQYAVLKALANLPSNLTDTPLPEIEGEDASTFSLIPEGQLGMSEDELPFQPMAHGEGTEIVNAPTTGSAADINLVNGTVFNGGDPVEGEGWAARLSREMANRYMVSTFCSWRATGGSVPGIIERLSDEELAVTKSQNNTVGHMFEKFSNVDVDSGGIGGEYIVQAGFGWTNGVVLWIASNYGSILTAPQCPSILVSGEIAGEDPAAEEEEEEEPVDEGQQEFPSAGARLAVSFGSMVAGVAMSALLL